MEEQTFFLIFFWNFYSMNLRENLILEENYSESKKRFLKFLIKFSSEFKSSHKPFNSQIIYDIKADLDEIIREWGVAFYTEKILLSESVIFTQTIMFLFSNAYWGIDQLYECFLDLG